jgi:hypothetical protein
VPTYTLIFDKSMNSKLGGDLAEEEDANYLA